MIATSLTLRIIGSTHGIDVDNLIDNLYDDFFQWQREGASAEEIVDQHIIPALSSLPEGTRAYYAIKLRNKLAEDLSRK